MRPSRLPLRLALLLALSACSDAPVSDLGPGDLSAGSGAEAQGIAAPGAEGLYEGDPLAGPDLDPTDDPL